MTDQFRISPLLPGQLAEHRISMPNVLRRAGLPAGFFQQEKVYATTSELFALWRAIGETGADPAIALKLGAETRLERFNPTSIAAVCSRTFRDALERSQSILEQARHQVLVRVNEQAAATRPRGGAAPDTGSGQARRAAGSGRALVR